jgi:hypothetical protein
MMQTELESIRGLEFMLNGRKAATLDTLIDHLSQTKKPVVCTASSDGVKLQIDCSSLEDNALLRMMNERVNTGSEWTSIVKSYGDSGSDPQVTIAARHDEFSVSLSAVRRYFEDYLVLGSATLARSEDNKRRSKVVAVVRLFPPSRLDVDTMP